MCATSGIMDQLGIRSKMHVSNSHAPGSQAAAHLPHLLATNASACKRYQRTHHHIAAPKRGYESEEHFTSDSDDENNICAASKPTKALKRRYSSSGASQDSSGTREEAQQDTGTGAFEGSCSPERACAEVLQLLRAGSWDVTDTPPVFQLHKLSRCDDGGRSAQPDDTKTVLPYSKESPSKRRKSKQQTERAAGRAPRRKYTWRSFHHREKVEEQQQHSEEETSASPEAVHPVSTDDDAPSGSSHKERDKEWAALTTWLRMNLHQPRTNKRVVLFTAEHPKPGQPWVFQLNPALCWDDVSEETKLRLKTLPEETEAAFAHKYPNRPSSEWQAKTQKYRPVGESATIQVPLGEMVYSLRDMYCLFESDDSSRGGSDRS